MIVIPMAGNSSRFTSAGYAKPKFMLDLDDRTLFDWSVLSFNNYFNTEHFLFVTKKDVDVYNFVVDRVAILGIKNFTIIQIDGNTRGQAETVKIGLLESNLSLSQPLVIFNIDTIRPSLDINFDSDFSGFIEVFEADGDGWSFIDIDASDSRLVSKSVEKVRISNLCSTGLYFFESCNMFLDTLATETACPSSHELFVAPLYNHLIAAGLKVGWRKVDSDLVVLSGIPSEYEALKIIGVSHKFTGSIF